MSDEHQLNDLQAEYKNAVEVWIASIRNEAALASAADHSVTEIDKWEAAHLEEDELRNTVKAAKRKYENALRSKFFGF
jgi:hypothetical protein